MISLSPHYIQVKNVSLKFQESYSASSFEYDTSLFATSILSFKAKEFFITKKQ